MQLSTQNITTGDTRRYQIDYSTFLQDGENLTAFIAAIATQTPAATSSINAVLSVLDIDQDAIFLYVVGGTVNENFTVTVQVTTNYGEIVNDTIAFTVVAA